MKKILFLGLLLSLFVTDVIAQMTIPSRPAPIKRTTILSQTNGMLNYVIENGQRTVFREINEPPIVEKVYLFDPQWYPAKEDKVETPAPEILNGFALLAQQFNRERRKLVRVIGSGNEVVYEYSGNILIGTKNGLINYVIRNGKRESYTLPQPPRITKIVPIWPYNAPDLQPKATPEQATPLDEQDFASYQQKLIKNRWQLKTVAGNCQEIVYYYER